MFKRVFYHYFRILKPYRWRMLANCLLNVGVAFTIIYSPIYIKKFFDALGQISIGVTTSYENVYKALIFIIVFLGLRSVFRIFSAIIFKTFTYKVDRALEQELFNTILSQPNAYFQNKQSGGLLSVLEKYGRSFNTIYVTIATDVLINIVAGIGYSIALFSLNKTIGLIFATWFVVFLVTNYFYAKYKIRKNTEITRNKSRLKAYFADTIVNYLTVDLFYGKKRERDISKYKSSEISLAEEKLGRTDTLFYRSWSALTASLEVLIFFLGLHYFKLGLATVGFFYLAYMYIKTLSDDLWSISTVIQNVFNAYSDAIEATEIFDREFEVLEPVKPKLIKNKNSNIVFDNVSYKYKDDNNIVLKDINLNIPYGTRLALVGNSGAGKTTFIKMIFRFMDPTSGAIKIDGTDLRDIARDDLLDIISFVPQESILFHRTIAENIGYGKINPTEKEIINAAKKAHAHEFIKKLPYGYDTKVGERGVKLSGGERQRISIARAILKNAPILILDEATSSLDSETEQYIQDALLELMKGKTVIAIAHRLSTIRSMDRILVLENGKITEDGNHEELLANPASHYKHLWQLQASGFDETEEESLRSDLV